MGQIKNIKLHIVTDIKCKLPIFLDHSLSLQPKMQFPLNMMHDNVWVERLNYIEAKEFIHLSKGSQDQVSSVSSSLVSEISSMRENIKTCVSGITSSATDSAHVAKLEAENKSLKKLIDDLSKQVSDLTLRVGKLKVLLLQLLQLLQLLLQPRKQKMKTRMTLICLEVTRKKRKLKRKRKLGRSDWLHTMQRKQPRK